MDTGRDIDEAIALGADRLREAEDRLIEEPTHSPELVEEALLVERRAEDVSVLADEALERATEGTEPGPV